MAERLIVLGFFDEVLDRLPVRRAGRARCAPRSWPSSRDRAMPAERHRLCRRRRVEPGAARRFDVGRHRICLVRIGDDFYAIGDRCSHADFSLAEGEVLGEEREIECWKHGSTFSLVDGEPQSLPGHPAGARLRRASSTATTSW